LTLSATPSAPSPTAEAALQAASGGLSILT
jgi:hypothetical protein